MSILSILHILTIFASKFGKRGIRGLWKVMCENVNVGVMKNVAHFAQFCEHKNFGAKKIEKNESKMSILHILPILASKFRKMEYQGLGMR